MITIDFELEGQPVPIFAFSVTGGAHGAAGSASVNTSITALKNIGLNLAADSLAASTPLPVSITTTDDESGVSAMIFSGTYTVGKWAYKDDTVMLQLRDGAGKAVDEKRVMTKPESSTGGVNTQNNTISGFVSNIAQEMGLTPLLNLAYDSPLGTIFGDSSDTIQFSAPQTFWGYLVRLARDTGNIVYATPTQQLYFGTEGQGPSIGLSWNIPAATDGSSLPLMSLDVEHNPARNASHKVTVNSYDPTKSKVTQGTKTKGGGSQRYTYHVDGLTAAQAQKRAESISKDISKREIIVTGEIDYYPQIAVGVPSFLIGDVDPVFAGYPLFVNQWSHNFRMPKGKESGDISTHLTLLKQGDK